MCMGIDVPGGTLKSSTYMYCCLLRYIVCTMKLVLKLVLIEIFSIPECVAVVELYIETRSFEGNILHLQKNMLTLPCQVNMPLKTMQRW